MEYCPEIAVLQSAFQLVSKKTGKELPDLQKGKCQEYVNIISTTIDEICTGLAHDLDLQEKLLWQEKLHLVHFYALVKKKYRKNENVEVEGKVPVYGALDFVTSLLPTYSNSFYFELMKCCDWIEQFLQSLQCLDYKTASSLFQDLLHHCHSNPVTFADKKVITIVSDKLLSRCLCVPDYPSELSVKLIEALNQSTKFVQTVYPEEAVLPGGKSVAMEIKKDSEIHIPCDRNRIGISFWDIFVERNPNILDTVMTHFESVFKSLQNEPKEKISQKLLETVSQLGVWNYLVSMEQDSESSGKWFISNVLVSEKDLKPDNVKPVDLVYSLNFTLLRSVCNSFPQIRLHSCLQSALKLMHKLFYHGGWSGTSEQVGSPKVQQNVQVVSGLTVNLTVLLRMLTGIPSKAVDCGVLVQKSGAVPVKVLEIVQRTCTNVDNIEEIVLGDTWSEDVTLAALLRRIDDKLPHYQVCVDKLLEDRNMKFWTSDRLYSVMSRHSLLLSRVDRVLQLTCILDNLKGDNYRQSLLDLICSAYTELSFPDQDAIIMEIYCSGHSSIPAFFREGLDRKVTNVFNKITADLDNQVLSEVTMLCLGDPVLVLRTAVTLCVRNQQQAVNSALIVTQLAQTCRSRHPVQHPHISLLAHLLQDFLLSQSLSEKEQKCFSIFVSDLMKPNANSAYKVSVLSPAEFLHTSVLPLVSVDNLYTTDTCVVSCKFAASLLLLSLEAGCNKACDWSEYEFEPMALVFSLAELKHECVVLWEMKNQFVEELRQEERVAMETNLTRLALKETVNQCVAQLCQMIHEGCLSVTEDDLRWLLDNTSDLHWTVRFGLCPLLSACNFPEYAIEWLSTLDNLLEDLKSSLVPVLQFIVADRMLVSRILEHITTDTQVDNDELIAAMVQVLSQCLASEFESVVMFIEGLQTIKTDCLSTTYRLMATFNLPLLDFSEVRPALYTSQLLGDVIITIRTTLTSEEDRVSVLPHVLQCYIGVMKTRCDQVIDRKDLQLLYLGELFHHVCAVTMNLPAEIMNSTLIFLLHILNKFKDVVKATGIGHKQVRVSKWMLKLVKNIENGMTSAVHGLQDCEEKNMIQKKLCNQS